MLFPARSNLLHGQEIASSGTERPPRNDTPFRSDTMICFQETVSTSPFTEAKFACNCPQQTVMRFWFSL